METLEFLDLVWGRRRSWVDVPSKINGHWLPANMRWPADRLAIQRKIAASVADGEDCYFSVAQFAGRGRRIADVLATRWLWSDLDRVDPVFLDEDHVLPTVAWESSPGRYQCLWLLTRTLAPRHQTLLNRTLTYAIGADRGGYDLTQVLRPVGTLNYKYSPPSPVELLWCDTDITYRPADLLRHLRTLTETLRGSETPRTEPHSVGQRDFSELPARARRLLRTPEQMVVVGERSARLWELCCLLAEADLDKDQIFDLVRDGPWDKYKELNTHEDRLRSDVEKAIQHVARRARTPRRSDDSERDGTPALQPVERRASPRSDRRQSPPPAPTPRRHVSPFVDYATFISTNISAPRWLIEEIWTASSHGIIGGEPKTSKSTAALAMALSVATGTPFLGKYAVPRAGPVILVQEENAPWVVQDRLRKIAAMQGLLPDNMIELEEVEGSGHIVKHVVRLDFPQEAPLRILNNFGFDLTDIGSGADDDSDSSSSLLGDLDMLEEEVRREGAVLVVLDPLYLMVGDLNMNHGHELTPVMQWLMALRYNHDCAVAVVHHWHKASSDTKNVRRPGQRLMGSGLLHGWVESAMYMEAIGPVGGMGMGTGKDGVGRDGVLTVRAEREFRNVGPRPPLDITWKLGKPGELDMEVEVREVGDASGGGTNAVFEELGLIVGAPGDEVVCSLKTVAEALGVDRAMARDICRRRGLAVTADRHGRGTAWYVSNNGDSTARDGNTARGGKTPEGGDGGEDEKEVSAHTKRSRPTRRRARDGGNHDATLEPRSSSTRRRSR